MNRVIITFSMMLFATQIFTQKTTEFTLNLQAYPTGMIPGIQLEKNLNDKSSFLVRLGYNWFRHRDLGVHDDERGGGFGGTIGYRRYFSNDFKGWSIAVKSDVWWNDVDWYDLDLNNDRVEGKTSITVLQPTAELGYTFYNDSLVFRPSLAFGVEWNVRTSGAPTGEGPIVLAGFSIGKRF